MPVYGFECEDCRCVFDIRASIQEKEAGLTPECPHCCSPKTHQVITAGTMVRGGKSGSSEPCCGPTSSGRGCCG